ncbi:MAG: hypothetical protein HFH08_05375 [Bacilli bacterium]|nr:hypothetical protein [Bacilli bacterium]
MKINGYDINIDSLMEDLNIEHDFYIKRKNGLMLKDSQIKILERYHIFYQHYNSLSSLLFEVEEVLNEIEADELEKVAEELSELHYYHETNK